MITYKLEKDIKLYKNQFEQLALDLFGEHKMDRLSIDLDSLLFRLKYMAKNNRDLNLVPSLKDEFITKALEMRTVFGEIMYNFLTEIIGLDDKYSRDDIIDILAQDVKIDTNNISFKMIVISDNMDYLEFVNNKIEDDKVYNMFPNEFFRYYTDSYNDGIAKAYPELFQNRQQDEIGTGNDADVFCHSFTFQTSENCSLNCTYCYQFNKSNMRMDFSTAKKFIDDLLDDKYGYINRYNSPAIILEFIGGEPLLEINLTRKIYEYFLERTYTLNHQWFKLHRLSICSNGLQYFDEAVQDFFKEYAHNISFNISIDGNKKLHDSCRIQPNGEGSYDVDMVALNHYNKHYTSERNSKMTLAPNNMKYLFDSVVNFINNGMKVINLNCIFEEGWNQETALLEYNQLKKLANYILENDLENLYIAIFNERQEDVNPKSYDGNFCFKENTQILTINGNKYIKDLKIGDHIYTASGSIHRVVKINKRYSNDNKILTASGIFPTHCTSDHKIFAKKFLYMGWKGVLHYSDPGFYPISELKKGDRIALPLIDLSKGKSISWLTEDFAYVLGIYIADGCINKSVVNITPGYDEDKFYFNALIKAGLTFNIRKMRTTIRYEIKQTESNINRLFYNSCIQCGTLSHTKHIPEIIYNSPKNIIEKVLYGYIHTDGYHVKKSGTYKINTVSQHLANDIVILLRSLGEYPVVYFNKRAGTMVIEDRTVNVKDRYEIYFNPNIKNGANRFKKDEEYNILWTGIRNVKDDEDYDVYCPTVMPINNGPEEHTVIANGIAVQQCGGLGSMLALRPNGQFYPCIRYMPTSVGDNVADLCIGNVDTGIIGREQGSEVLKMMDNITRRSQMNDICYDCPIGNDCASCSALGHAVYGTPGKRTSFICIQMIAEALANVYYWNLLNIKKPEYKLGVRKNNVPREWSLLVIDEDELKLLEAIELRSMISTIEYGN